jgi:hypothetical protein
MRRTARCYQHQKIEKSAWQAQREKIQSTESAVFRIIYETPDAF